MTTGLTQEDILAKLYRDLARLAGEIALDRCRQRVLLGIVRDRFGIEDAELDRLFRDEIQSNLAGYVHDITDPMLAELRDDERKQGCCGGHAS